MVRPGDGSGRPRGAPRGVPLPRHGQARRAGRVGSVLAPAVAYREGKGGGPMAVTGASEDLARCAIAAESNGEVWVAYCANRGGTQSLHLARVPDRGQESRVTVVSPAGVPHLSPALTTLSDGR